MSTSTDLASSQRRICSRCKISKPADEFNFRNRAKGVRHIYCRECGKEFTRNHYRRNRRQYIERSMRANVRRREFMREMKSRPCADCGVQYPYYVMDFDHREGEEKVFEMNRVSYVTLGALKREIEKCDVVCSNCHRERTYQRIMQLTLSRPKS
jgi:hypothetical protein